MNFDLANVRPFLLQLNQKLDLDLHVEVLVSFTEAIDVGTEKSMTLTVSFQGQSQSLSYSVFKDDFDAPDLYFFSIDQRLTEAIQAEMISFAEERGL